MTIDTIVVREYFELSLTINHTPGEQIRDVVLEIGKFVFGYVTEQIKRYRWVISKDEQRAHCLFAQLGHHLTRSAQSTARIPVFSQSFKHMS